jgi:hypothetical protein
MGMAWRIADAAAIIPETGGGIRKIPRSTPPSAARVGTGPS